MNLYLDLELLPLDARGIWIDEPLTSHPPTPDGPAAGPTRPALAANGHPPPARPAPAR